MEELKLSTEAYTDFRIPGIVASEKGSLLRYCECRRDFRDWADIDIRVERSEDGGENWTTTHLIPSYGHTLNNPVMFVYGEELIFLYCKDYKEVWKCVSYDDGKSFGESERVNFEDEVDFVYNVVALGPGHGIVHEGRLIVGAWFAYDKDNPKAHWPSVISTFYSDDGGKSFHVGEVIRADFEVKNPSETALAITAEGEYLMSIRHMTEPRYRLLAKSKNGISDWYGFRFEELLPDPVCMGGMTHKDGRIYHCNCDSQTARENLTVKISSDGFASCEKIYVCKNAGYSDVAILGDELCIYHELHEDGKKFVGPLFTKIPLK